MSSTSSTSRTTSATKSSLATKSTHATSTRSQERRREDARLVYKEFRDFMKRLEDHAVEYADFDTAVQERDDIIRRYEHKKLQLAEKEKELRNAKNSKEFLLNSFCVKYDSWKAEKEDLLQKASEEKANLIKDYTAERSRLQTELEHQKSQLNTQCRDLTNLKEESKVIGKNLDATRQELDLWEKPLARLRQLDAKALRNKLERLSKACASAACAAFQGDLSSEILNRQDIWESGIRQLDLPFGCPPTNSESAKHTRVAIAWHTIARELCGELFKPCHIPSSVHQSTTLEEVLDNYLPGNQRASNMVRALLLSANSPEELRRELQDRAQSGSVNVLRRLRFMCNDNGDSVGNKLNDLFAEAADLWEEIQHTTPTVKVVTHEDPMASEWPWEEIVDFGEIPASSLNKLLTLFPGFYVPADDLELYKGYALWEDQSHLTIADNEWKDFLKRRAGPTFGRGPSRRSRAGTKHSISIPSPTSPSSSAALDKS